MAAFAPIPSASDRIATTVTNGVLKSARSESLRLRMTDGVRDLRERKPIGLLSGSLQVDETLLLIRELTPAGWASVAYTGFVRRDSIAWQADDEITSLEEPATMVLG